MKNACFCGLLKDWTNDDGVGADQFHSATTCNPTTNTADVFPCSNVDLLSHLPLTSTFGSSSYAANDIWGWTHDPTGREFAILGLRDGTAFVEISDPSNPLYLGKLPTHTGFSTWRDIKTYNDHAFIVSEASKHGMQIFDLTRLLTTTPVDTTTTTTTATTFEETAYYNQGVKNLHNLAINEDSGYAYLLGGSNSCSGGLHMVDISNPRKPRYSGCFSQDGYTHDAHCVLYAGPDTRYTGKEICVCSNTDTVTIVDVTNKKKPVELSRTSYNEYGFTHQGWLSSDHTHFIFGDETDESDFGYKTRTLVLDVSNLKKPNKNVQEYLGPSRAIDHNLYIMDYQQDGTDYIFQANYRAGLRILKVENYDTADFQEVGYFDIYPSDDLPNYNGAWSVYPYFPSGTVVVSGMSEGLFVLSPHVEGSTPSPTSTLAPVPCEDDPDFAFRDNSDWDCEWVAKKLTKRCEKEWNRIPLSAFCPLTCDTCDDDDSVLPTAAPIDSTPTTFPTPIPSVPTEEPTESPPSPFPTTIPDCSELDCASAQTCTELFVRTDSNPQDTRVRLKDQDKEEWLKEGKFGDYPSANTLYTERFCLYKNTNYELVVQDRDHNGFQWGGYYSLVVNGETLVDQKSNFGKTDRISFQPNKRTNGFCSTCSTTETCIQLFVMTDSNPQGTRWRLFQKKKDDDGGGGGGGSGEWLDKKPYGNFPLPNTLYRRFRCHDNDNNRACFKLVVQDKDGNGFGSGGYYSLKVDGETIVNKQSNFREIHQTWFGEGC